MRIRRVILTLTLLVGTLAGVGAASAQEEGTPGIDQLVSSFFNGAEVDGVFTANDPEALSPFGGPSMLPPDTLDAVTLDGGFHLNSNPGEFPGFTDRPVAMAFRGESKIEMEITKLDLVADQFAIPPVRPGGASTPDSFFDIFLDIELPAGGNELFGQGEPFEAGDVLIVPPAVGSPPPFDGPVVIRGGRTRGALPFSCPGDIIELFSGDAVEGAPLWEAQDFAPNDSFDGLSQAHVTRCVDGQYQPTELLVNNGDFFDSVPTGATMILTPVGWVQVIPLNEIGRSTGERIGAFITPVDGGFQPDNTGFTTAPPFPQLRDPGDDPFFIENPLSGHVAQPVLLEFGSGTCSPDAFGGNYLIGVQPTADTAATGVFDAKMVQLDTLQLATGMLEFDPGAGTVSGDLTGTGDGYTENYSFGSGTYEYDAGSLCTWGLSLSGESAERLLDDMIAILDALEPPATTTTTTTTTTTAAPTTTTAASAGDDSSGSAASTAATSTATDGDNDDGGGIALFPVLLGLILLALGLFWYFFFNKTKGHSR